LSSDEAEEEPKTGQKAPEKKQEKKEESSSSEEDDEFGKFLKIQTSFDKKRKTSLAESFSKQGSNQLSNQKYQNMFR
jgi:hypothetical protein